MDAEAFAFLERQYKRIKAPFEPNFYPARRQWHNLLKREARQNLPEQIRSYARDVDVESPAPMKALNDFIAIEGLCGTKLDIIPIKQGTQAKKDITDIRNMLARHIRDMDETADASENRSRGPLRDGVCVERMGWCRDDEPAIWGDWTGDNLYELANSAATKLMARDKEYEGRQANQFGVVFCDIFAMCWGPDFGDPDWIFEDIMVPYVTAREYENDDGKKLRMDDRGAISFGQGEAFSEAKDLDQSIHVLKCAHRTGKDDWELLEYVYPDGKFQNVEPLTSRDCPLGHSPYFITASGEEDVTQSDPHFRYWPGKMAPLYQLYHRRNFIQTLKAMIDLRATLDESIYLNVSRVQAEQLDRYVEAGIAEYVGARDAYRLTVSRSPLGKGEVHTLPGELLMWPHPESQTWERELEIIDREIAEFKPNRWLTGLAFEATSGGTAALGLAQMQASAVPFGGDLKKQDRTVVDEATAIYHCYCEWYSEGVGRPLSYAMTGKEPVRGKVDAGSLVIQTSTLMKYQPGIDFVIEVITKNETDQERMVRINDAIAKFRQGLITDLELYEEMGYDDPYEHQGEVFEMDNWNKYIKPQAEKMLSDMTLGLITLGTGFNAFGAGATGGAGGTPVSPPPPAPPSPSGFASPGIQPPEMAGVAQGVSGGSSGVA